MPPFKPSFEQPHSTVIETHDACSIPLPVQNMDCPRIPIEILLVEGESLCDSKSAAIEHRNQRAVPDTRGGSA